MKVLPYGERGTYVDLGIDDAADRAARTHTLAGALRAAFPQADVISGAGVVALFGAAPEAVRAAVSSTADVHTVQDAARTHAIDVVYDGPDLDDVTARLGVSREGVIELHTGREYTVEVVGFLPGFAYLAGLDPLLVMPRRASPRPRVAAQSVAVAGEFSGIYPLASPGGWNLLGRSLGPPPFDPERATPFLFAPGDRVRFRSVEELPAAADAVRREPNGLDPNGLDSGRTVAVSGASSAGPALIVVRPPGPATVQDAGRRGWLGRGMPPSGPLDPGLLTEANRAVGNAAGAAAIELLGGALELRARGSVVLSVDGAPATRLEDGESMRIGEGEGAVRYVALQGGVDVPEVMGARATLLAAKLGGIEGRVLRRGDVLRAGGANLREANPGSLEGAGLCGAFAADATFGAADTFAAADKSDPKNEAITIDPGPHLERFPEAALALLLATEWQVSRLANRIGTRLEGDKIPRTGPDLAAPVPMRRGAVQVTTDGTPIVLGPDHPTTGGYPVLAVVRAASFGVLAQKRPGEAVRFRLAAV